MKKFILIFLGLITSFTLMMTSCKKDDNGNGGGNGDPCQTFPIQLSLSVVNASGGQNNGQITANASGGSGIQYSLNGAAFSSNNSFSGLAPNMTYTVTAKNAEGCSDSAQATIQDCTNSNISVSTSVVDVTPCGAAGSISVTATGSSSLTYSINGAAFQAGNVFSSLTAGNYSIVVKDQNGCTASATAAVGTKPMGPQFTQVRSLVNSRCGSSSCHLSGGSAGGYNFDNNCSIISAWSQINTECVTRNAMPPGSPLGSSDKAIITSWISGGHTYVN